MSNSEVNVAVKSFSGTNIEDMKDFLQPIIRRTPDELILHVGTNNEEVLIHLKVLSQVSLV